MRVLHDRTAKTVSLVLTYAEWLDLPSVSSLVRIDGLTRAEQVALLGILEALERPGPPVDHADIKDVVHHG